MLLGLIKSDARPGGNVTGLLLFVEGLPGKQLELMLDLIPGATKIGLVINPDNASSLSQLRESEAAVAAKAIKVVSIEVRTPENVDSIFPTLAKERVDAAIVLRDTVFFAQRARLAVSAMAVRVPTVYGFREPGGRRAHQLRHQLAGKLSPRSRLRGQDPERRQARRPTD